MEITDDNGIEGMTKGEEYSEITLKNKVTPRDRAKLVFDHAKMEMYKDIQIHGRLYKTINGDGMHLPIVVDAELDDLMKGAKAKLEFTNGFIIQHVLKECNKELYTSCFEQGELMEKMLNEIQSTLTALMTALKKMHMGLMLLVGEKNTYASKAMALAKTMRSVCFHDIETTLISTALEYSTLIGDIALKYGVSTKRAVSKLFWSSGGSPSCLRCRIGPKSAEGAEEESMLQSHTKHSALKVLSPAGTEVVPAPPVPKGRVSATDEEENDNISDMLLFIETLYRGKLMHMLLSDVKNVVLKLHDDDNKAAVLAAQQERNRRARERAKVGSLSARNGGSSQSVIAAREKIKEAEQSSRRLMARMLFRKRDHAAYVIQRNYQKYITRRRNVRYFLDLLAENVLRFVRLGLLRRKLYRMMTTKRRYKLAIATLNRALWAFLHRLKKRRSAAAILDRNLRKLHRNRRYRHMAQMVRSLAAFHFQKLWATRWGELESRLCRVEMYMDLCGPISVAQHALLRSETLQTHEFAQDSVSGMKKPSILLSDERPAAACPQTAPSCPPLSLADNTLTSADDAKESVGGENGEGCLHAEFAQQKFYEKELAEQKDVFHQRLQRMADWRRYRECCLEKLQTEHKETFSQLQLSEEDLDGFGRGEVLSRAVHNLEGRCNVYAIVGASALRMGTISTIAGPAEEAMLQKAKSSASNQEEGNTEPLDNTVHGRRPTLKKTSKMNQFRSQSRPSITERRNSAQTDKTPVSPKFPRKSFRGPARRASSSRPIGSVSSASGGVHGGGHVEVLDRDSGRRRKQSSSSSPSGPTSNVPPAAQMRYRDDDRVDLLSDVEDDDNEDASNESDSSGANAKLRPIRNHDSPARRVSAGGVVNVPSAHVGSVASITSGEVGDMIIGELVRGSGRPGERVPPQADETESPVSHISVSMTPTTGAFSDPRAALRPTVPLIIADNRASLTSSPTGSTPLSLVDGSIVTSIPPAAAELYSSIRPREFDDPSLVVPVPPVISKPAVSTSKEKSYSAVAPLRDELMHIQQRLLGRAGMS